MVAGARFDLEAKSRRIDIYRRTFDVVVSALLLLVAVPLTILLAVGSALVLGAWPFFTQERVGLGGEMFRFWKVRTLRPDVPGYIDKHQLDVDRIPRFCQILRDLHLDELPQLFLVLRGKMSLVGPRPEMAHLHNRLAPAFADLRTSVRPGCTGMWQVSELCTELIGAAPQYDRFYLAHRTLRLDVWILFRTALNMLGIGRCITLADVPTWAVTREDDVVVVLDAPHWDDVNVAMPTAAAR